MAGRDFVAYTFSRSLPVSRFVTAAVLLAVLACVGLLPSVQAQEAEETPTKKRTPDVVFVPTPDDVVDRMLKVAGVTKDDVVYDLGCGDGRIVVTAAKKYGCHGIGYDINPVRVAESKANAKRNGVEHLVTIKEEDIFAVDLSKASVITLYLLPSMNVKLIPQLQKLKPGSRIVAHDYGFEGKVKPEKTITMVSKEDSVEHIIYLWTVPLKVNEKATEEESEE
jgi:SAM-dependent methyltransferase